MDKKQEENFDEKIEEVKTVKSLTTKVYLFYKAKNSNTYKELKNLAKPEFQKNPEKFYPTKVFEKFGFSRNQCPKCNAYYWRHSEKADVCGDSKFFIFLL